MHSRAIIELEGQDVKEVLKKGCPFNFNNLEKNSSINSKFTLRKSSHGEVVERVFPLFR